MCVCVGVGVLVCVCMCVFACMYYCIYLYTCIIESLLVCNKLAIVAHYGHKKKKKKKIYSLYITASFWDHFLCCTKLGDISSDLR